MRRVLGCVLLAAVGLTGLPPEAKAASGGVMLLSAVMDVSSGVAYPCMGGEYTVQVDPGSCNPLAFSNYTAFSLVGTAAVANSGSWTGVNTVDVEGGTAHVSAAGAMTGRCGLTVGYLSGQMISANPLGNATSQRSFVMTWVDMAGLAVVTGTTNRNETIFGNLYMTPDPSNSSCLTKGPKRFILTGPLFLFNTEPRTPPVSSLPPVTLPGGGPEGASTACTSGTIHDGTTAGVRSKVRVQSVDARTTWVCVRVGSPTSGYGGQFVVTTPAGAPTVTGLPSSDSSSGACTTTTPNGVPGPHPLAAGQVGDPGGTPDVAYLMDAYSGGGQAWVCLRAGGTGVRVIVPTSPPGASGTPTVTFNGDPGTPDPI